jgi:serine protease inhibitor
MNRAFTALLSLAFVASACGQAATPSASGDPASGLDLAIADVPRIAGTEEDAAAAGAAIDAFGLDLYRRIAGSGDNVVVSPASIAIAVAMARAGARGDTAAQIDAVLRSLGSDEHAAWISALDQALASRTGTFKDAGGEEQDVTLRIANAPFAQRDMPLEQAYLEALAARFGAGLRLVDYMTDSEAARKLINGWVDEQTEQRIPELLAQGVVTPLTRLMLVNAVYLKAAWRIPFPETATAPAPFTRPDGTAVDVPMMSTKADFTYAAGDGWQAVELPYVGGQLAMTIVVPDDLASFVADLDTESYGSIVDALVPTRVDLSMPKFGIETKTGLADALAALGMPLAFDPDKADFSGMTTAEQLYVAAVIHQANIDVDEKGTEAAAATAIGMNATSLPAEVVALKVDRPFLFALRDVPTGAILFLGQVTDPSAGG